MLFFWNEVLYRPIYNMFILIYDILPIKDAGLAIIVLTLVVRFILLPLTWAAMKSQRMTQSLQPAMNKIKEQYKNDKQKQGQELMKFYQENGINPLSSCLPMLVQLPVMIALYQVLRNLNQDQFSLLYGFVQRPESFNTMFLGVIDLMQPFWPLAILTGLTQFAYSYLLQPMKVAKTEQTDVEKSKKEGEAFNPEDLTAMMGTQFTYLMPIMTTFISWNLLSGLPLYWVVTTLFNVAFQLIMVKKYPVKLNNNVNEVIIDKKEEVVEWKDGPELIETVREKNVTVQVKKRK